MSMKNKLIICLLNFALTCQFGTVYASQQPFYDYHNGVVALFAFGVLEGEEGAYEADSPIKRGEFAHILSKVLGYENQSISATCFPDIPLEHEFAQGINLVAGLGIISGFEDGTFCPNEEITWEQAIKMLVVSLGYDMHATNKGGYPFGYYSVAAEVGIIKDITISAGSLNKGQAAQLFLNTLEAHPFRQITFGNNPTYSKSTDQPLMYTNLQIVKGSGRIIGNSFTYLHTGTSALQKDQVDIDGVVLKTGKTYAREYLGYYVEYYYREFHDDKDNTLVYVRLSPNRNKVISIFSDPNLLFFNWGYSYMENQRSVSVSLDKNADIIYNGKPLLSNFREELMKPDYGYVHILDSQGDGRYETVFIQDYQIIIVGDVDLESEIIYDKYDASKKVDIKANNPSQHRELIDEFEVVVELSEVKSLDVITVERSLDESYIKAVLCKQTIIGQPESIQYDQDGRLEKIIIEDEGYKVSPFHKIVGATEIDLKQQYTFYFDKDGLIVLLQGKTDDASFRYGYLINNALLPGIENKIEFKLLNSDGNIIVVEAAPFVYVDNMRLSNSQDLLAQFQDENKKVKEQLIRYRVNNEGEISEIDTSYYNQSSGESAYSMQHLWNHPTVNLHYHSDTKTFAHKFHLSDSSIVFEVPDETVADRSDEKYRKYTHSRFARDSYYNKLEAYSVIPESAIADVVVRKVSSVSTAFIDSDPFVFVDKITVGMTEDGESMEKIYVFEGTKQESYFIDKAGYLKELGIEEGDVIRIKLDTFTRRLIYAKLVYDVSKKEYTTPFPDPYGIHEIGNTAFSFGRVYSKSDNGGMTFVIEDFGLSLDLDNWEYIVNNPHTYYWVNSSTGASEERQTYEVYQRHVLNDFKNRIYKYYPDSRNEKYRLVSEGEIKDYLTYGNECSKVAVHTLYASPKFIVILE